MTLFSKHKSEVLESDREISPIPELQPHPHVYPGTKSWTTESTAGLPLQRSKRIVKRKVSPFTLVLVLLGAAVIIVLYISNIIAVGQLMGEINTLETQHRRILMEQEILRAQINKMASLERIQELAEKDLGLATPKDPPVWLNVDRERLKELRQTSQKP